MGIMEKLVILVDKWMIFVILILQGSFSISLVLITSFLIKIGLFEKLNILLSILGVTSFILFVIVILIIYSMTFETEDYIPKLKPTNKIITFKEKLLDDIRINVKKGDYTEVLRLQKILWGL